MSPLLREVFVLYGVWGAIVGHTCDRDPRHVDPHDIYGMACAANPDRIAGRVYADGFGDTFDDARDLVHEVLDMAVNGRRPRYGLEVGLTADVLANLLPGGAE